MYYHFPSLNRDSQETFLPKIYIPSNESDSCTSELHKAHFSPKQHLCETCYSSGFRTSKRINSSNQPKINIDFYRKSQKRRIYVLFLRVLSVFRHFYHIIYRIYYFIYVSLSRKMKEGSSKHAIRPHQFLITDNQLKQCTKCTILLADEVFSYPKTLQNHAQQANNQKRLDINILQQNGATCARIAYSAQKYGRVSNFRFSRHFKFRKSRAKHRFCAFERISSSSF